MLIFEVSPTLNTPLTTNIEPENKPVEREKHRPTPATFGFNMFAFEGAIPYDQGLQKPLVSPKAEKSSIKHGRSMGNPGVFLQ